MLFLVKRTSQHFMEPTFTMLQVYNNAVSSKPAEMQFISGYFKTWQYYLGKSQYTKVHNLIVSIRWYEVFSI